MNDEQKMTIVVLSRGWIVCGLLTKGDWISLNSAYVVRRWGTTKGLGEIAENGPTKDTILDQTPPMEMPASAVINTIVCDTKAWKKWIRK